MKLKRMERRNMDNNTKVEEIAEIILDEIPGLDDQIGWGSFYSMCNKIDKLIIKEEGK